MADILEDTPLESGGEDIARRRAGDGAHRVRIGLTGLAFVFLLVLVGTAILNNSDPAVVPAETVSSEVVTPVEPMAEIGAAPSTPKSEAKAKATQEISPPAEGAPTLPREGELVGDE